MSKTSWFQITLLAVWGVSAAAALSGSFWLTRADWVQDFRANADTLRREQSVVGNSGNAQLLQNEVIVLRDAVTRLDRQNRILMSRLEVIEDETGSFTASIPSELNTQDQVLGIPRSQQMPTSLSNSLTKQQKLSEDRVYTRIDPYPLKMQGTNRAPTDAEISEALKGDNPTAF